MRATLHGSESTLINGRKQGRQAANPRQTDATTLAPATHSLLPQHSAGNLFLNFCLGHLLLCLLSTNQSCQLLF